MKGKQLIGNTGVADIASAQLTRRTLFRALAVAGVAVGGASVLAGCGGGGGAAGSVRLTQAVQSLAYAHNYIAGSQGFYRDAGLEVETIVTDGGGPDVQAVLTNSAGYTINDGCQVLAGLDESKKLVAVQALFSKCLVNATMSNRAAERLGITAGSTIESRIESLKGQRIGITAPGALTWQVARYDLIQAGLNPDRDAEIVALGGGPAVQAALENDQVDVIYITVPIGEAAVSKGIAMTLIDNAKGENPGLPAFMMEGLWTRSADLDGRADEITDLVESYRLASDFISSASIAEIVDSLREDFSGFDEATLSAAAERLQMAVAVNGAWDNAALTTTTTVLEANGLLNGNTPPAAEVVTDRFIS